MEKKVYKENPYLNSNKEPLGLTIKGKTRDYVTAHKKVQALIISGKNIVTDVGKIKIVDSCKNRGMIKAKVEINTSEMELGEAELKVYDPSLDRKKGATIEIRKLSDSEYEFVEKLRDVITCLLDKFLSENEEKPALKTGLNSSGEAKYFVCDVCDWQTRSEAALKGHKKRMHEKKGVSEEVSCNLCPFKSSSKATLIVHKRIKQAGAELGQAQLKLILDFNQIQYTFGFSLLFI